MCAVVMCVSLHGFARRSCEPCAAMPHAVQVGTLAEENPLSTKDPGNVLQPIAQNAGVERGCAQDAACKDQPQVPLLAKCLAEGTTNAEDTDEPGSKSQARKKSSAAKKSSCRDGGHENFVRLARKKGQSSFKYMSKSGSSQHNAKSRKWAAKRMAAESLPVAGLGADSAKESWLVCLCQQHKPSTASLSTCFQTYRKEHEDDRVA
jgi:hypothetical protein